MKLTDADISELIDLHEGESLQGIWRPTWALFALRELILGGLTSIAVIALIWSFVGAKGILLFPVFLLIFVFAFDDFNDWMRQRHIIWALTNMRIVRIDQADMQNQNSLFVGKIDWVSGAFPWRVDMREADGTILSAAYLKNGATLRAKLKDMM